MTPDETIARLESLGMLDPTCLTCVQEFYPSLRVGREPFVPGHQPSKRCESGKRPHCTCPVCWG